MATHDLVVIGGGPGGYTAAIRASQLGLNVACIEKEELMGGTCLRVGCIPSKALLESSERFELTVKELAPHGVDVADVKLNLPAMMQRKTTIVKGLAQGIEVGLFKKHKITRYKGYARFAGASGDAYKILVQGKDGEQTIEAKRVIIATGSKEAQLKGVAFDGDKIGCSTEALSYPEVPKHLVVIGAGAIGLEMGSVWRRLGAQVTVLEYADRILPTMDTELSLAAQKIFVKQGLDFRLKSRVTRGAVEGAGCIVDIDGAESIKCDRILLAAGRVPNTDGLELDKIGITLDPRGRIPTDAHFATSARGVFAIGDVIAGPMLAHKAEEEAVACVEHMQTGYGHVDYNVIAYVVYTEPEVASVGLTEEQLQANKTPYRKGTFPFLANGRARALANTHGFVKMLAHAETDRILGVHIVGPHASDLISEAAVAMAFGASSEDLARVCHAHPTLSEAVKEAALAVDNRTLNL